jgi:hypothetical protein
VSRALAHALLDELIDVRRQLALRDQRRIEIPHGASRRVPGIGERRLILVLALAVQTLERRSGK